MIAQPKDAGPYHVYFLVWLNIKHPEVKFARVCKTVKLQSTGGLAFPKGEIRLWAQQKKQRLADALLEKDPSEIRGLHYPVDFDPFETFLLPTDIFDFIPVTNLLRASLFSPPRNTMSQSTYTVEVPKELQATFTETLMSKIKDRNPDDEVEVSDKSIVMLPIHDDENTDLSDMMATGAKHFHDVPTRDGKSTTTSLHGRAFLKETNEKFGESTAELQTFPIGKKAYQVCKVSEKIDTQLLSHTHIEANERSTVIYGNHAARDVAFEQDATQVTEAALDGRWTEIATYYVLPNTKDGKPIKYSNAHHNEELLGYDHLGDPQFADNKPADEGELLVTHTLVNHGFNLKGGDKDEEEEENNEEGGGDDDENLDDAGEDEQWIGVSKAMLIFQLAQEGTTRGKKKKNQGKSPLRAHTAKSLGSSFTPTKTRG